MPTKRTGAPVSYVGGGNRAALVNSFPPPASAGARLQLRLSTAPPLRMPRPPVLRQGQGYAGRLRQPPRALLRDLQSSSPSWQPQVCLVSYAGETLDGAAPPSHGPLPVLPEYMPTRSIVNKNNSSINPSQFLYVRSPFDRQRAFASPAGGRGSLAATTPLSGAAAREAYEARRHRYLEERQRFRSWQPVDGAAPPYGE
ncbi:hypothetical protein STCU_11130 [Strigomonas culicis]|uniref:Uncharacterized protein n=1 Tax=Strigomonas culicis TaxID=28005 RepID=S9V1C0_9TRYP|nr:hypothetical protein STCU_11130 [Strigomonas culicis]|eukprot:EPY16580.1 hypothetical protein STCU_11130 [Strigomonas culicis]